MFHKFAQKLTGYHFNLICHLQMTGELSVCIGYQDESEKLESFFSWL